MYHNQTFNDPNRSIQQSLPPAKFDPYRPQSIEEKQAVQPLITPVSSLNPSQDPYDDKDKLDQLISDVQRFEKHVSTMTKKILNGTVPLEVEWKVRIES